MPGEWAAGAARTSSGFAVAGQQRGLLAARPARQVFQLLQGRQAVGPRRLVHGLRPLLLGIGTRLAGCGFVGAGGAGLAILATALAGLLLLLATLGAGSALALTLAGLLTIAARGCRTGTVAAVATALAVATLALVGADVVDAVAEVVVIVVQEFFRIAISRLLGRGLAGLRSGLKPL